MRYGEERRDNFGEGGRKDRRGERKRRDLDWEVRVTGLGMRRYEVMLYAPVS